MKLLLAFIVIALSLPATADRRTNSFDPSDEHPFGRPNPDAPEQLSQFAFLIGKNDCTEARRSQDGQSWNEGTRTWDAHYSMNGFAVYDTGISDSGANSNQRVFDEKTGEWHVTFFSTPNYGSGVWRGVLEGDRIVLKQPQAAPANNMPGFSRLTFSEINDHGFNWIGEWVSADNTVVYPFWRISCRKVSRENSNK